MPIRAPCGNMPPGFQSAGHLTGAHAGICRTIRDAVLCNVQAAQDQRRSLP